MGPHVDSHGEMFVRPVASEGKEIWPFEASACERVMRLVDVLGSFGSRMLPEKSAESMCLKGPSWPRKSQRFPADKIAGLRFTFKGCLGFGGCRFKWTNLHPPPPHLHVTFPGSLGFMSGRAKLKQSNADACAVAQYKILQVLVRQMTNGSHCFIGLPSQSEQKPYSQQKP